MLIIIPHYGAQNCIYKSGANLTQPSFILVGFGMCGDQKDKMSEETPKRQSGKKRKALGSLLFHNYENYDPGPSKTKNLQKRQNCNK